MFNMVLCCDDRFHWHFTNSPRVKYHFQRCTAEKSGEWYKKQRRPAWSDMKMYWCWKIECFVPQYSPVISPVILPHRTFSLNTTTFHNLPIHTSLKSPQLEINKEALLILLPSPPLCVHKLRAARNTQTLVKCSGLDRNIVKKRKRERNTGWS